MNTIERFDRYVIPNYTRYPVTLVRGEGSYIWSDEGKRYIDFFPGWGCDMLGHCPPKVVKAIQDQLEKLVHVPNSWYMEQQGIWAEMLSERSFGGKAFFCNSGAEANECAIKTARKWAAENKGEEYFTVVTMKNSFHGRTLATLAATGQDVFHKDFLPVTPGFAYTEPEDIDGLRSVFEDQKCAAVLLETVQGEGGVRPLSTEYLNAVAALCAEYNVLLMIDEVQTGNGRCGYFYSYMQHGIEPDVVTTAKGLGGGLPVGAVLFSEKTAGVLTPGTHGSTFGGNPVCCAGAVSIVSRIDDAFLASVRAKSDKIFAFLSGKPGIKGVYGRGLLVGVEVEGEPAAFINKCIEKGVLVLGAKGRVRLAPPLNIGDELLDRALSVITKIAAGEDD